MRVSRTAVRVAGVTLAVCVAGVVVPSYAASSSHISLRSPIRITSPGQTALTCPVEGEPAVTVTSAGTWVGYNDDQGCPLLPTVTLHLSGLQLIPAGGGAPRYVRIDAPAGEYLSGDPALAPDPQHPGSVLLATLQSRPSGLGLAVYSVSPSLRVTTLPNPSVDPKHTSDDKELIASDTNPKSRFRGRTYLAWDDFTGAKILTFRAFNGRRWEAPVRLAEIQGAPDVAVAPNGDVAVTFETATGVGLRISYDGGKSFTDTLEVLRGGPPGRLDPACPLRPSVGQRQRVIKSPRVTYDSAGIAHVVAALGGGGSVFSVGTANAGLLTGGYGTIRIARTRDGINLLSESTVAMPQGGDVQFNPAIARTPKGGIAVEWLQTTGNPQTSFNSWLAVAQPGSATFAGPVKLSDDAVQFPPAFEIYGNSDCYGIGDYTGLASTREGVVAVWPTSGLQVTKYFDTDVLAREAVVR